MNPIESADPDAVLSGRGDWIDPALAERFSEHPLDSVEREFPHYVRSIDSPDDVVRPSEQHPVFYGCYDWHSAVHSHWSLCRQLRLFADHPAERRIVESVRSRLTPENVEREVAHVEENPSFEKPYGWGWLLRLAAELHLWEDPRADEWRATLRPLEDRIVALVETEFLTQERPLRVGTHGNSAFALGCVLDYARVTGDASLESAAVETSRRFYADDRDYPLAYEPIGWDFLSPGLAEADLLGRVLDREAFAAWLDGFLPDVTEPPHDAIPVPVGVDPDADDGMALHLVGLNLSRAWCMAGIADVLGDHPYAPVFERSARDHAEAGLAVAFTDAYAGSHWLTSFALYLLTRNDGGIAPD
ncbi:DUF2891 domain-containing protein [Halovivax sp.]|uniref:DUF2891 domain-containing protein n=1 Tax=Halovivax sp. TaxID=1935978 RepID=UPI0025BD0068|nr:DUF2891 domain-containing protein [Halovivax sp.]